MRLADEVANRLRNRSLVARTIGLKLRFADFHTVTRVRTLPKWVDAGSILYSTSVELYQALALDRPRVRLLGVKAEGLRDVGSAPEQLTFDDVASARPGRPAALDRAADHVKARFGQQAVRIARLLPAPASQSGSEAAFGGPEPEFGRRRDTF